ncbi:MAG: hypothetical protein ACE5G9_09990 [Nitrospinales bacterium]
MLTVTPFKLVVDPRAMFSKALNTRMGHSIFVTGYRRRMRRGLGVDAGGNPARHKPLQKNARPGTGRNPSIPLLDTGEMVRSFRVNRARTTDRLLVMDFPAKERRKAVTHQFGDSRRNIPARPHVGASRQDMKNAVRFLKNFWAQNFRKFIRIERG